MSTSRPEGLYKRDFYAWSQQQAKELRRFPRTRPNLPLDLAHLAEEIRDLGKSDLDEPSFRLDVAALYAGTDLAA